MTVEIAKSKLKNYYFEKKYLENKLSITKNIKSMLVDLINYNKKMIIDNDYESQINRNNNDIIEKIIEEENYIINSLDELIYLQRVIDQIDQPYRSVLYYRYILSMEFIQIAETLNYTDKRIYQLHSEALEKFANVC